MKSGSPKLIHNNQRIFSVHAVFLSSVVSELDSNLLRLRKVNISIMEMKGGRGIIEISSVCSEKWFSIWMMIDRMQWLCSSCLVL